MRSGANLGDASGQRCFKILLTEAGTLHLRVNGSDLILAGANALCMHDLDFLEIVKDYRSDYSLLCFSPTVINPRLTSAVLASGNIAAEDRLDRYYLLPFIREADEPLRSTPLSYSEAATLRQQIKELDSLLTFQDDTSWTCRSRSYILFILFALSRTDESKATFIAQEPVKTYSPLVADVIHFLQTNYQEKITSERLAAQFHTNRTTLLAEFSRGTGQSVNRYLTRLRVTMAAALLRDTGLSMMEICEKTGFSDISYFCKTFKKEITYTPSEYRRRCAS